MPIFEYLCLNCKNEFEELVLGSRAGENGLACPKCKSTQVQKLLSGFHARSKSGGGGEARSLSSGGCSSCTSSNCAHCK